MDARTQAKIEASAGRGRARWGGVCQLARREQRSRLPQPRPPPPTPLSQVLGTSYQEELLHLVAPEHLMERYGGTNPAPLSAEPGPWQDPDVRARLEAQRQQRLRELGVPEGMSYPPVPGSAAADSVTADAGGGEAEALAVAAS